ncbi:MAG: CaiB/BaiF CoA-transferase family protein [Haloarculaceae archaeon]
MNDDQTGVEAGGRGPLVGLNVVELTVHRAGPFCGALLADLGAEVVKIERPGVGDPTRVQGPGPENRSGYFMANNRNKQSVELDLKSEAGREVARELVGKADVFVENMGYGVADRLGLGYDDLSTANPDLVYASVKGYGETGPLREKKGMDLVLQAEGGIMSVTGPEGGDPVKVGQAIGDLTAGMFATIGILARLQEVAGGHGGGKLDVGLFDAVVSMMNEYLTFYSMNGEVPGPQGTTHQSMVPYQLFETDDGYLVTAVPADDRWDEFVDVVGCESVREYGTNAERVENETEVVAAIQTELAAESTEYWQDALEDAGFPVGPLNDVADVVGHEQAEARGLVPTFDDPDAGEVLLPGHPVHFPDHSTAIRSLPPELGEHTEAVLRSLGHDDASIARLREAGAVPEE